MSSVLSLTKRNTKLFFKDKGLFFTSLITPIILLVLYATFLAKVYRDSFASSVPQGFSVDSSLIDGLVGSQLFSSLLAVCCITVAFCCNALMVQDKVSGAYSDIAITPVKRSVVALGYYISTFISTAIICLIATGACFLYLARVGWYLSATDILLIFLDVFLLVMFGTVLSSVIHFFLTSQGQVSAVGTIVSAGYGFICGAYMPISQFGDGLQRMISILPGTYGTSLIRNHAMRGVFAEMKTSGFPAEVIKGIRDSVDCNLYFGEKTVGTGTMYIIIGGSVLLLLGVYILMNVLRKREK